MRFCQYVITLLNGLAGAFLLFMLAALIIGLVTGN